MTNIIYSVENINMDDDNNDIDDNDYINIEQQ